MKHSQSNAKKAINRVVSAVMYILLAIMVVAVCYFMYCNVSGKVAFVGKYAVVKIISPSMEPMIPTDSYILAEKVSAKDVGEGDVIMFYSKDPSIYGRINTHRVVNIEIDNGELIFTTKGDNNPDNDAYTVSEKDIVGRYVRNAEKMTAFIGFFSNPIAFFALVIIPAAVLVVLSFKDVVEKAHEARIEKLVDE